jgi:hypothetical protein
MSGVHANRNGRAAKAFGSETTAAFGSETTAADLRAPPLRIRSPRITATVILRRVSPVRRTALQLRRQGVEERPDPVGSHRGGLLPVEERTVFGEAQSRPLAVRLQLDRGQRHRDSLVVAEHLVGVDDPSVFDDIPVQREVDVDRTTARSTGASLAAADAEVELVRLCRPVLRTAKPAGLRRGVGQGREYLRRCCPVVPLGGEAGVLDGAGSH